MDGRTKWGAPSDVLVLAPRELDQDYVDHLFGHGDEGCAPCGCAGCAAMRGEINEEALVSLPQMSSYGVVKNQDRTGAEGAVVSDDGRSVTMSGNAWKQAMLDAPLTIEKGMTLTVTLDVAPGELGEIHGIGLDDDADNANGGAFFRLGGTQGWAWNGAEDVDADLGGGPVTVSIDLSAYAGQSFDRLVFVNDDDDPVGGTSRATWSDVSITKAGALPDGLIALPEMSSYGAASRQDKTGAEGAMVSGDGRSVTMTGNAWKQAMLDAPLKIEKGMTLTVTLDVAPGGLGEVHGIGLDRDSDIGKGAFFQLGGTQTWKQAAKVGADLSGGPVTVSIDLSAYAGQSFDRLVFVNDDDDPVGGTSMATWSDVSITKAGDAPTAAPPPPPSGGAGEALPLAGLTSYAPSQDKAGVDGGVLSSNGASVLLAGNAWKQALLDAPLTVEKGMTLTVTLDVASGDLGEVHGIGLDNDADDSNGGAFFQLGGTQDWKKASKVGADLGAGPETVSIDLSAFAGQSFDRLVFVNDDDNPVGGLSQATWSNVSITAAGETAPGAAPNVAPKAVRVDAGTRSEDAAPIVIDLLAGASDADGDVLKAYDLKVTSSTGAAVKYTRSGGELTIDPDQFGGALDAGESAQVDIAYKVSDGRGGVTSGSAGLTVAGADEAGLMDTYVSGAKGAYNMEIVFEGTWTTALQQAFIDSADWISSIIVGDLPEHTRFGEVIDDVRISAELTAIDGRGGVLGQAGPTALRSGSYLPTTGTMRFDSADASSYLSRGTWDDIVFHEMMHAIGFGTIWSYKGLLDKSPGDARFTGANAIEAYKQSFPNKADADSGARDGVPVEMDGGGGTAFSHWDDKTFGNEVMTGYLNSSNRLTDMTIASLEDLGYDTVWDMPLA